MKNSVNEMDIDAPAPGTGAEKGRFFVIDASFRTDAPGPGLSLANYDRLRHPGHYGVESPNGDPDQYPEVPRLVRDPELGGAPRDSECLASIWIVSEALKRVFEAVDREAFAFAACDYTLADGSVGPPYYLCDVVRELDAIDEDSSRVRIKFERDYDTGEGVKYYSILGGASLAFRQEVIGRAHIFRQPRLCVNAICDRFLAEAVTEAGLCGVAFRDVSDL